MPRPHDDPIEDPATEPDLCEPCAICGRDLCSDGDQARNLEALDL